MYGVVYLILNKINSRKYVGQTVQPLKVRFKEHARKKDNTLISNAIRKYGKENFYCGVIKTCASKEELDYWEKYYIAALKTKKPCGYNLTDGGEGIIGYHLTPEQRAKISAKNSVSLLGNKNTLGYRHTPESRAKMSATERGNNPFKNLLYEMETRQLTYKTLSKLIDMPLSSLSFVSLLSFSVLLFELELLLPYCLGV